MKYNVVDIPKDQEVLNFLQNGSLPEEAHKRRRVRDRAKTYMWDGESVRIRPNEKYPGGRIVPAYERRKGLLDWGHKSTNHMGALKLQQLIQKTNWWQGLRRDCQQTCHDCPECKLAVTNFKEPKTKLEPVKVEKGLGRSWAIDLTFGFPKTARGNHGFIVAIERLSRWIEVEPVSGKSPAIVARFILKEIIVSEAWGSRSNLQ